MEDNEIQNGHHCIFNRYVRCNPNNRDCANCGWNPRVAQVRLERICNTLGVTVPKSGTGER